MPRFCANLSMMFVEYDFLERFQLASRYGFHGVEYLFPYDWEKEQLAEKLQINGLVQVLHNLPAGDWSAGERGIACIPGRQGEFQDGVGKAIDYATALNCNALNCLVGLTPQDSDADEIHETLISNLSFAAKELDKVGIRLLVEALNSYDIPGFFLVNTRDTVSVLNDINHANAWYQYDIYHMQKMEGNLIDTLKANLNRIAHIQLADNPGRHEPGTGEINFANLFNALDEMGYGGWIGCEYNPAESTEAGIGWFEHFK